MKVELTELREIVLGMLEEARKKPKKEERPQRSLGPKDFRTSHVHDYSWPLGDENYLKRQGASNFGPYTDARQEPENRGKADEPNPDELREATEGKPPVPKAKAKEKGQLAPKFEKLVDEFSQKICDLFSSGESPTEVSDDVRSVLRDFARQTESEEGESPSELDPGGPKDDKPSGKPDEVPESVTVYEGLVWQSLGESYLGFDALKKKLSHRKGVKDPGALAASIGRNKYGKGSFQKMAASGRKG